MKKKSDKYEDTKQMRLAHRKLRARIYFPRKHTGKVWITEW